MNTIKVSIRLADGGLQEFNRDSDFLQQLRSLQSQGFSGKQLVHRLLTDDWAAPPTVIEISGMDSEGKNFEIRIPYV